MISEDLAKAFDRKYIADTGRRSHHKFSLTEGLQHAIHMIRVSRLKTPPAMGVGIGELCSWIDHG
jgi:hypothetical protein